MYYRRNVSSIFSIYFVTAFLLSQMNERPKKSYLSTRRARMRTNRTKRTYWMRARARDRIFSILYFKIRLVCSRRSPANIISLIFHIQENRSHMFACIYINFSSSFTFSFVAYSAGSTRLRLLFVNIICGCGYFASFIVRVCLRFLCALRARGQCELSKH